MRKFSVVIPCVNGLPVIAECLTAIRDSAVGHDVEIIVIDRTGPATCESLEGSFSEIKLVSVAPATGIPEMRSVGFDISTGEFVASIEDHCIVPKDWFLHIGEAHRRGHSVVGGSVENGCVDTLTDWAAFLCEYSNFMAPIPHGEVDFVAGNNVSYERKSIEQLDVSLRKNYWEYFLQAEMVNNGTRMFSDPSITLIHKKTFGFFYFLSQRFHYSRSFAAMRRGRSTTALWFLYLAYVPFLPFHSIYRIGANVYRKRRHKREFWASLPILALFLLSYAAGEAAGHLAGPGDSLAKVE